MVPFCIWNRGSNRGGRGGIRTHGELPHTRFRVECLKPDSATLPFFFQAEDGIRDDLVTGVQTCALPIFAPAAETTSPSAPAPRNTAAPVASHCSDAAVQSNS